MTGWGPSDAHNKWLSPNTIQVGDGGKAFRSFPSLHAHGGNKAGGKGCAGSLDSGSPESGGEDLSTFHFEEERNSLNHSLFSDFPASREETPREIESTFSLDSVHEKISDLSVPTPAGSGGGGMVGGGGHSSPPSAIPISFSSSSVNTPGGSRFQWVDTVNDTRPPLSSHAPSGAGAKRGESNKRASPLPQVPHDPPTVATTATTPTTSGNNYHSHPQGIPSVLETRAMGGTPEERGSESSFGNGDSREEESITPRGVRVLHKESLSEGDLQPFAYTLVPTKTGEFPCMNSEDVELTFVNSPNSTKGMPVAGASEEDRRKNKDRKGEGGERTETSAMKIATNTFVTSQEGTDVPPLSFSVSTAPSGEKLAAALSLLDTTSDTDRSATYSSRLVKALSCMRGLSISKDSLPTSSRQKTEEEGTEGKKGEIAQHGHHHQKHRRVRPGRASENGVVRGTSHREAKRDLYEEAKGWRLRKARWIAMEKNRKDCLAEEKEGTACVFTPTLSPYAASLRRPASLRPENRTQYELLQHRLWEAVKRQERVAEELKECTFHPLTIEGIKSIRQKASLDVRAIRDSRSTRGNGQKDAAQGKGGTHSQDVRSTMAVERTILSKSARPANEMTVFHKLFDDAKHRIHFQQRVVQRAALQVQKVVARGESGGVSAAPEMGEEDIQRVVDRLFSRRCVASSESARLPTPNATFAPALSKKTAEIIAKKLERGERAASVTKNLYPFRPHSQDAEEINDYRPLENQPDEDLLLIRDNEEEKVGKERKEGGEDDRGVQVCEGSLALRTEGKPRDQREVKVQDEESEIEKGKETSKNRAWTLVVPKEKETRGDGEGGGGGVGAGIAAVGKKKTTLTTSASVSSRKPEQQRQDPPSAPFYPWQVARHTLEEEMSREEKEKLAKRKRHQERTTCRLYLERMRSILAEKYRYLAAEGAKSESTKDVPRRMGREAQRVSLLAKGAAMGLPPAEGALLLPLLHCSSLSEMAEEEFVELVLDYILREAEEGRLESGERREEEEKKAEKEDETSVSRVVPPTAVGVEITTTQRRATTSSLLLSLSSTHPLLKPIPSRTAMTPVISGNGGQTPMPMLFLPAIKREEPDAAVIEAARLKREEYLRNLVREAERKKNGGFLPGEEDPPPPFRSRPIPLACRSHTTGGPPAPAIKKNRTAVLRETYLEKQRRAKVLEEMSPVLAPAMNEDVTKALFPPSRQAEEGAELEEGKRIRGMIKPGYEEEMVDIIVDEDGNECVTGVIEAKKEGRQEKGGEAGWEEEEFPICFPMEECHPLNALPGRALVGQAPDTAKNSSSGASRKGRIEREMEHVHSGEERGHSVIAQTSGQGESSSSHSTRTHLTPRCTPLVNCYYSQIQSMSMFEGVKKRLFFPNVSPIHSSMSEPPAVILSEQDRRRRLASRQKKRGHGNVEDEADGGEEDGTEGEGEDAENSVSGIPLVRYPTNTVMISGIMSSDSLNNVSAAVSNANTSFPYPIRVPFTTTSSTPSGMTQDRKGGIGSGGGWSDRPTFGEFFMRHRGDGALEDGVPEEDPRPHLYPSESHGILGSRDFFPLPRAVESQRELQGNGMHKGGVARQHQQQLPQHSSPSSPGYILEEEEAEEEEESPQARLPSTTPLPLASRDVLEEGTPASFPPPLQAAGTPPSAYPYSPQGYGSTRRNANNLRHANDRNGGKPTSSTPLVPREALPSGDEFLEEESLMDIPYELRHVSTPPSRVCAVDPPPRSSPMPSALCLTGSSINSLPHDDKKGFPNSFVASSSYPNFTPRNPSNRSGSRSLSRLDYHGDPEKQAAALLQQVISSEVAGAEEHELVQFGKDLLIQKLREYQRRRH